MISTTEGNSVRGERKEGRRTRGMRSKQEMAEMEERERNPKGKREVESEMWCQEPARVFDEALGQIRNSYSSNRTVYLRSYFTCVFLTI